MSTPGVTFTIVFAHPLAMAAPPVVAMAQVAYPNTGSCSSVSIIGPDQPPGPELPPTIS